MTGGAGTAIIIIGIVAILGGILGERPEHRLPRGAGVRGRGLGEPAAHPVLAVLEEVQRHGRAVERALIALSTPYESPAARRRAGRALVHPGPAVSRPPAPWDQRAQAVGVEQVGGADGAVLADVVERRAHPLQRHRSARPTPAGTRPAAPPRRHRAGSGCAPVFQSTTVQPPSASANTASIARGRPPRRPGSRTAPRPRAGHGRPSRRQERLLQRDQLVAGRPRRPSRAARRCRATVGGRTALQPGVERGAPPGQRVGGAGPAGGSARANASGSRRNSTSWLTESRGGRVTTILPGRPRRVRRAARRRPLPSPPGPPASPRSEAPAARSAQRRRTSSAPASTAAAARRAGRRARRPSGLRGRRIVRLARVPRPSARRAPAPGQPRGNLPRGIRRPRGRSPVSSQRWAETSSTCPARVSAT